MNTDTSGATTTVAKIPAGYKVPKSERETGVVAANAETEADSDEDSLGKRILEEKRETDLCSSTMPPSDA